MKNTHLRYKNRDLSWLAFNHRVLQEAADKTVPLYERIKFLAIFSSNLDEFYRVRVGYLQALVALKKKAGKELDFDPERVLRRILKVVAIQQHQIETVFRNQIRKELGRQGIYIVKETALTGPQKEFARKYFQEHVQQYVQPVFLSKEKEPPFLENKGLYLAVKLLRKPADGEEKKKEQDDTQYAIVEVPASHVPRFLIVPRKAKNEYVMFLDDLIRLCLPEIFPNHTVMSAHVTKLTRDAELYIDDESSGDLLEKIKKALSKRKTGLPSRFLYDADIPRKLLVLMKEILSLREGDLVAGGRYHNFSDFFNFPNPKSSPALNYPPMQPVRNEWMAQDVFAAIEQRDRLLYYPYHPYDAVIRFLQEAAVHPKVSSIQITLYRVARDSEVVKQLINAAQGGKKVTAFVEVKARFDEESNIRWAEELEKAGVRVLYSFPGMKVHAKLCLVTLDDGSIKQYAYLSTGNFNEKVATLYTDFGFFTADKRLTDEVTQVFEILSRNKKKAEFEHLLVAPFNMREKFEELLAREMKNARSGQPASVIAKMNGLEDADMIGKLYEASEAGVRISLIVRGICCLIPGVKGMSGNIQVTSIVDRFLEHARVFIFHNGGEDRYFLSSADLMRRNLSHRIEAAFPIYDKLLQEEIRTIINLQLSDNTKARIINKRQDNSMRKSDGKAALRAQYAIHDFLNRA